MNKREQSYYFKLIDIIDEIDGGEEVLCEYCGKPLVLVRTRGDKGIIKELKCPDGHLIFQPAYEQLVDL